MAIKQACARPGWALPDRVDLRSHDGGILETVELWQSRDPQSMCRSCGSARRRSFGWPTSDERYARTRLRLGALIGFDARSSQARSVPPRDPPAPAPPKRRSCRSIRISLAPMSSDRSRSQRRPDVLDQAAGGRRARRWMAKSTPAARERRHLKPTDLPACRTLAARVLDKVATAAARRKGWTVHATCSASASLPPEHRSTAMQSFAIERRIKAATSFPVGERVRHRPSRLNQRAIPCG